MKSKDSGSRSSSVWPRRDDSLDYMLLDSTVLSSFINFPSFSLVFLLPFLGGASLIFIVAGVASQPSTWTTMDPHLDTCPISVLLMVIE